VLPGKLSVNALFNLLKQSVSAAREALGADHALVPLEPWATSRDLELMMNATQTGRAQLVITSAGRQIPVLRAAVYPLGSQPVLAVGRTSKSSLIIDQPTVSRSHADIVHEGEKFEVVDKGSYNGTMINDRVLEPNEKVPLRDGDVIVFGEAQMVFGSLSHLAQLIRGPRRNNSKSG
jgi:pSer/pThr/pTyr-binding forkhead associated (FHA) protein